MSEPNVGKLEVDRGALLVRPSPWTLRSTTRCFVFALRRGDLAALAPKHPALLDALRSKPA